MYYQLKKTFRHLNEENIKEYSVLNSELLSPDFSLNDIRGYLGADNRFKLLNSVKNAFYTALQFCNVAKGDLVITQAIGPKSALDSILEIGAIPLLVDSEAINWNISAVNVEMVINNCVLIHGVRPKAIVLKHYMGVPAFMDEVCAVAHRHQIPIIEDCIGAFGSYFQGRPCGTLGQYAVFSVFGERFRRPGVGLLVHRVPKFDVFLDRHLEHEKTEYKGDIRADDTLPAWQTHLARRKEIYQRYAEGLADLKQIEVFQNKFGYIQPNYGYVPVVVKCAKASACREKVVEAVTAAGYAGCCVFTPSLNQQPQYSHLTFYGCRVGSKICTNGFVLPSQPALSNGDVDRIIAVVRDAAARF